MPAEFPDKRIFLDTNILIHAFSTGDPRHVVAERLLAAGGTISVQVLNEFTNVMRRKLARPWPEIEAMLGVLSDLLDAPLPLTAETHAGAVALARDHGFSFYDALVIASAQMAGCTVLASEDMHDGHRLGALTITNPFRESTM